MRNSTPIMVMFTFALYALLVHCSVSQFRYPLYGYGHERPQGYLAILNIGVHEGKDFHLLVDTGSPFTWIQCAGDHAKPAPSQPYKPFNNFLENGDPDCPTRSPRRPAKQVCKYRLRYQDETSSTGDVVKDIIHLHGHGSTPNATLIFGCGNYQGPLVGERLDFDGLLGLGIANFSFISQLKAHTNNIFGHCLGIPAQGAYSGYIFFGSERASQSSNSYIRLPMQQSALGYYVIGPATLSIEGAQHGTNLSSIVLDTGSTLTHFNSHTYTYIIDTIKSNLQRSSAPLRLTRDEPRTVHTVCWKGQAHHATGPSHYFRYFKPIILYFRGNKFIKLRPRDYLRGSTVPGNICMRILENRGLHAMNLLGANAMVNKLVMYDNRRGEVAWGTSYIDCRRTHRPSNASDLDARILKSVSTNASSNAVHGAAHD